MWLEWRDGWITFIRDYRYVQPLCHRRRRKPTLAPEAESADDGAAQ